MLKPIDSKKDYIPSAKINKLLEILTDLDRKDAQTGQVTKSLVFSQVLLFIRVSFCANTLFLVYNIFRYYRNSSKQSKYSI